MKKLKVIIFLFAVITLSKTALSQDGTIDSTFGDNGRVLTLIGSKKTEGNDIAIQKDQKLIVAGTFDNGNNTDFAAARYNTDGSLDDSFGDNGFATSNAGPTFDYGIATAIQSDGKIIVAGYGIDSTDYDFGLVRFTSEGKLDSTFGKNGRVLTPVGTGQDYLKKITIQKDDKIIAVGSSSGGASIVRYLKNGELDNSFGTNGIVYSLSGEFFDVKLQSNGKICAAGFINDSTKGYTEYVVARHNSDGSPDNSFGNNGIVTITNLVGNAYSIAIQADNKLVVAGITSSSQKMGIIRLNTDGSVDKTFGNEGLTTPYFATTSFTYAQNILLQSDNKIVVTGHAAVGSKYQNIACRFNTDGSLDATFNDSGFVLIQIGRSFAYSYSSVMLDDGSIILAGKAQNNKIKTVFALTKLNNNSTPLTGVKSERNIIHGYKLWDNYPNPFNPSTTIRFSTPITSRIKLVVYDMLGKVVKELIDEIVPAGIHEVNFDATQLSSGVYIYKISSNNFNISKKLVLLK